MMHMHAAWNSFLSGFPVLLVHLALTTGLLLLGIGIFLKLLYRRELDALRQGSMAASVVFSGQVLALAIPLAAMMAYSVSVGEIILWGIITVVLQWIALHFLRLLLPDIRERLMKGECHAALLYASCQIVTGLLNAAALSG
jgi:putative membrane protein